MKYRRVVDLTDEEIIFIVKDIFDTDTVTNIKRNERCDAIECDIHIMDYDDGSPYYDTISLQTFDAIYPLETHDFTITSEESMKWQQFLIAKGVNWRFKDNPYMERGEL